MKRVASIVFICVAGSSVAGESRTLTRGVEHMTCATCPITVRKALSRVPGMSGSTVDMKAHTATVTFDAAKATPDVIATAVTRAGFPAKVLRSGH
jgi:mercuric ion binding protein